MSWSIFGWETAKEVTVQTGNGKPPWNVSCLENPMKTTISQLRLDSKKEREFVVFIWVYLYNLFMVL